MADFAALQAKYAPVVDTIKEFEPYGAKFVGSELTGEQYHLVAQVPSQVVENLKHEITNTGGADQKYTIQPGDNLSKVSKLFYGDPNHYAKIAEASGISDPNKVQVGQQVTVPAL